MARFSENGFSDIAVSVSVVLLKIILFSCLRRV